MYTSDYSSITAYLFKTVSGLAGQYSHFDTGGHLSTESVNALTEALNALGKKLGHSTAFSFPDPATLTPAFATALRDLFTDLNRSQNPLNSGEEHKNRVKDPAYHQALASFYDGVSHFLNATGTPIERGSEQFPLTEETQEPVLLKRVFIDDGKGGTISQLIETDHIDLEKKPVLCLGGTASFLGNTRISAGLLQLAEDALGGEKACKEENVELYCVAYPAAHRTRFFRDTHAYNAAPDSFYTPQAKTFCNRILIPLLTDQDGQIFPLRELKKSCAKFNFFAYSYGTVFAQEVRNYLRDFFVQNKLPTEDIKSLLANSFCMNLGPLCRLDAEKPEGHFSSVHIISETDLSLMNKSANLELLKQGKGMIPLRENEVIIRAKPPSRGTIQSDDFDEELPPPARTASSEKMSHNPSGHSASFYAKPVVNDEIVHNPRYIGFSLPEALEMDSAYRHVDERFLPPRKPPESFSATPDGRITPYTAAVMQETARKR